MRDIRVFLIRLITILEVKISTLTNKFQTPTSFSITYKLEKNQKARQKE